MNGRKRKRVPSWARVHRNTARSTDTLQLTTTEEASYLRTRAFHLIAGRIDEAFEQALRDFIEPLLRRMLEFFQTVSPEPKPKTGRTAAVNRFVIAQPTWYDSSAIPVALLHGPVSSLDRQACMGAIVKGFQTAKKRMAICVLRKPDLVVTDVNHCGPLVHAILRQCIEQDRDKARFKGLARSENLVDRLLLWAKNTEHFDSIVVFLQDIEQVSSFLRCQFLQTLAELRSKYGLPLQLVILNPLSNQGTFSFDSSIQGTSGMVSRRFDFPASQDIHDRLWELMILEFKLPVFLPTNALSCVDVAFTNFSSSTVKSIQILKQVLSLKFHRALPSVLMDDVAFLDKEGERLRCCLVKGESWEGELHVAGQHQRVRRGLVALVRVFAILSKNSKGSEMRLFRFLLGVSKVMADKFAGAISNRLDREKRFQAFVAARLCLQREVAVLIKEMGDNSEVRVELEKALVNLERVLLLLDESLTGDGSGEPRKEVDDMVEEWIMNQVKLAKSYYGILSAFTEKAIKKPANLLAEQRRDVAESLINGPSPKFVDDELIIVSHRLYNLISEDLRITGAHWFSLYKEQHPHDEETKKLELLFALGVYQLMLMGLIHEKRQAGQVTYEKSHVVWCNG